MALLGDLKDIVGVHRDINEDGEVYYWIFSKDYESDECPKCLADTCLQKVIFQANKDGSVNADDCLIIHDCACELN